MEDAPRETLPRAEIIPFPRASSHAGDQRQPASALPLEQAIAAARVACVHLGDKIECVIIELERSVSALATALEANPSPENSHKLAEIRAQLAVARFMIASLPKIPAGQSRV